MNDDAESRQRRAHALQVLCDETGEQLQRVAVVVAHPDDEVIGLGGLLPRLRRAAFIYTTDGAPRDMNDAERAGFTTRGAYREARQAELEKVFALAGIQQADIRTLPFIDKETTLNLAALTGALRQEFEALRPSVIFTHAYEGGHPDHDSTAFAVHHALCFYNQNSEHVAPLLVEFTSYHQDENDIRYGAFLAHETAPADEQITIELSPAACELKREMFRCFASQAVVLEGFAADHERFRIAPHYDFTQPPHAGRLHYETFDWGWTGERWRELARLARRELSAQ